MFSLGDLVENVRPTSEQLFGLCEWVSRLRFFQQFPGDRVAAICNCMTLTRLEVGVSLLLVDRLYIILDGEFAVSEKNWILQPGDTFGYGGRARSVVSKTEAIVGSLDPNTVLALFESHRICWTPELSRTLLLADIAKRTPDDIEIILDLLLKASAYVKNQPPDVRASIARLATLRKFSGDVDNHLGKGSNRLYIVLSGSFAIVDDLQEPSTLCIYGMDDAFPKEVVEQAIENRVSMQKRGRRKKRVESSLPSTFRVVAETHHAELVEIDVEHFIKTAFPSTEIPYSLEFCRRVLSIPPMDRSTHDLERLTKDLLQHLPFFSQFSSSTCPNLARTIELVTLSSSSLPGSQREVSSCLGVILSGVVRLTFDDGESHILKACDTFGRRSLFQQERELVHAVLDSESESADVALLSKEDYERSVKPKPQSKSSSVFAHDLLEEIPSCLRMRLFERSCVKEFDSHRVLGPVDRVHGLILSGSVSVHYASRRDADGDDSKTDSGIEEAQVVQLAAQRIDDERFRSAWKALGLGECACILDAGHSLGAELFSSKKRSSFQERRTNAGIAVCRQATRVLTFDPEKLYAKPPRATRAESLAVQLASIVKDRRRFIAEGIVEVVSGIVELSTSLPGPLKLRVAHAARIERVESGAVLESETRDLRIVLNGDFRVELTREHPADDVEKLVKREVWTKLLEVGRLGAGDAFGGRCGGNGGGILNVAAKLSEAYRQFLHDTPRALEAAAAAAVAESAASVVNSDDKYPGPNPCSLTCSSPLGATLLVVGVKDLCDAACLATARATVVEGMAPYKQLRRTTPYRRLPRTTSKLQIEQVNPSKGAVVRPSTMASRLEQKCRDEESSLGSSCSEQSLEARVFLARRRQKRRVLTAKDQAKLALLLSSPVRIHSLPSRPHTAQHQRTSRTPRRRI